MGRSAGGMAGGASAGGSAQNRLDRVPPAGALPAVPVAAETRWPIAGCMSDGVHRGTASEGEPCCNGALCHRHSGVSIMFELANDVSARPERSRSTAPVEGMPLAPYLPYQQKRSYQRNSDDLEIWHRSRIDKSLGARTARCRGGGRRRWCGRRGPVGPLAELAARVAGRQAARLAPGVPVLPRQRQAARVEGPRPTPAATRPGRPVPRERGPSGTAGCSAGQTRTSSGQPC
jgi:hypothetical protein